jgi:hypothetical protein
MKDAEIAGEIISGEPALGKIRQRRGFLRCSSITSRFQSLQCSGSFGFDVE